MTPEPVNHPSASAAARKLVTPSIVECGPGGTLSNAAYNAAQPNGAYNADLPNAVLSNKSALANQDPDNLLQHSLKAMSNTKPPNSV